MKNSVKIFLFTLLGLFFSFKITLGQGYGMSDAINVGSFSSCAGGSFHDYRNNSGYDNNYGQSSGDIWYTFTLNSTNLVNISTCSSSFDTYLHLLDEGGNLITSVDDNGPLCSGVYSSIQETALPAGIYYVVAEGYSYNTGNIDLSIEVEATDAPIPVGSDRDNSINVGTFNLCTGGMFKRYANNSPSNCYGNSYGQPSDDIWYRFALNGSHRVTISLCGSDFDTYLHLLNSDGSLITSNDDNGPVCGGLPSSIQLTLSAGTYYVVAEGYSNRSGNLVVDIHVEGAGGTIPQGTALFDPIDAGEFNLIGGTFSHTASNDINNCYGNEIGQSSDDIFYIFKLKESLQVDISHCESAFDTYLHLLDSAGNLIASNDDYGPLCAGNQASISTLLPAGTYYVVSEGFSTRVGPITTLIRVYPVDKDKNWVQSNSYDYNGNLIGQSKTFFNNQGALTQTQVKNISDGQVLASEILYDVFNRPAIESLVAPINKPSFAYKDNFIKDASGRKYNFTNFDMGKKNNPDPLENTEQGTLGWYYSPNNMTDLYVPSTNYPYRRVDYNEDGTNTVKRASEPGDELRMGKGRYTISRTFKVGNELNHYLLVRNKFFPQESIGQNSASVVPGAFQNVTMDINNDLSITICDEEGKPLMSAVSGGSSYHAAGSQISLSNYPEELAIKVVNGSNIKDVTVAGSGDGQVFSYDLNNVSSETLLYTGALNDYVPPSNIIGPYGLKIRSTKQFVVSYSSERSPGDIVKVCENCPSVSRDISCFCYLGILPGGTIELNTAYNSIFEVTNVATGEVINSLTIGAPGIYKISLKPGSADHVINYTNFFSDISYNFYNQLGQLTASIAPEGVKMLFQNNNNYNTLADVPFATTYQYDVQGRIISTTSPDVGRTEYIYRGDGRIRFSQNAEQRKTSRFSYTNYDQWTRPIESGEYVPGDISFTIAKTDKSLQESVASDGGLTGGGKQQWVRTYYDYADNSHGLSGYSQDEFFLKGGVSRTENEDGKTWFNYDSEGRLIWMIKQINGWDSKTIDYTYNAMGGVSRVDYQRNSPEERFVHDYEYNSDGRLMAVYTSIDPNVIRKEQARYYYYLHGPIKRIELAQNLQGLDYIYNVQGFLKAINYYDSSRDPGKDGIDNGFAPDAFGMSLEYYLNDYSSRGGIGSIFPTYPKSYFTGIVQAQYWRSDKPASVVNAYGTGVNQPKYFSYEYDYKHQYRSNTYGTIDFGFNEETGKNREYGLTYDMNGNIQSLNRTNSSGSLVNALTYHYQSGTNRLISVDNYATYQYDDLGQMTAQVKGGQGMYLTYDVSGKVKAIYSDAARTQLKVSFGYDEGGTRIRKTDHVSGIITYYVPDASGNVLAIYDNNGTAMQQKEVPVYGAGRIGMYKKQSGTYQYELTDHLGNVRVVINQNKTSGGLADVIYYSDYYPYGSALTLANNDYRYGYQGQFAETDKESAWLNFALRMYDPVTGRWMTTDPYGQYHSPYVGMGNDPVNGVDPDGGYSYLGAKWRQGWALLTGKDPSSVYYNGKDWGFNTSSSDSFTPHFGLSESQKERRSLANLVNPGFIKVGQFNPRTGYIQGSGAVEFADPTFDIALAVATWGGGTVVKQAAKTGTSLVQVNRTAGNLFRDELAAALRAEGRTVNSEVFKRTPFGKRYMDLDVWHNGVNLGGIETKVGGSRYLPLQRLKDAWLGANGYPVLLVRKPENW